MSQVLSVDAQHFIIVPQFAIFGSQSSRKQVQDEDSWLLRLTDEFDAQRLRALTLYQGDLDDGAVVLVGIG